MDRAAAPAQPNGGDTGHRRGGTSAPGQAVPRASMPVNGGGSVIVSPGYGGFYPWGFAYGGAIGGYYGGYFGAYDPWYGWFPTYGPSYSAPYDSDQGSLRLKVKPIDASVYVDGYYAGVVDDFDGIFQRLHLEAGPHRVEIRAPRYDTLTFDVRINADETTTYRGALVRAER